MDKKWRKSIFQLLPLDGRCFLTVALKNGLNDSSSSYEGVITKLNMTTLKAERVQSMTTLGLTSKEATLHVQHSFFVHFFADVLHDHNVKLPETSSLNVFWRNCRTCSRSLFFHCRSFSPCIGGRYHFSFCHRRYKIFMLFFQQKKCLLRFFIARSTSLSPLSLSFAGLPPTFSFSLSFSCSIFQICGHEHDS